MGDGPEESNVVSALAETKSSHPRKRRYGFDDLRVPRHSRVTAQRVYPTDIPELLSLAKEQIPTIRVNEDTPLRILEHDPDAIRAIKRDNQLVGLYAYLTFNDVGLEELTQNHLDTADPPTSRLASPDTPPAAIYIWAMVGLGLGSEMMCHLSAALQRPLLANTDIYAMPTTSAGRRFLVRLGFDWVRCKHPNLLGYRRRIGGAPHVSHAS